MLLRAFNQCVIYSVAVAEYDRYAMVEEIVRPSEERDQENAISDPRAALVVRVASSRLFSKAPKLQQFLLYISEHSLAGRLDLISESHIGIEVFKRRDSYNPGEDNIVRTYARTLRKRLDEYFSSEGSEEQYVLEIPRGGYVLEFRRRDVSGPSEKAASSQPQDLLRPLVTNETLDIRRPGWIVRTAFIAVTALLMLGSYYWGKRNAEIRVSSNNIHRFWNAVLGDRETVIVPSDTGLTVVLGLIQRGVTVQEYVTNEHLKALEAQFPQLGLWDRPIAHRYSDFVDVLAVQQFDRTPEISDRKPVIRYARDLKADELEKGNAILLGASNSNPWVQLFDENLNFHLEFRPQERTFRVENRHPLAGEPSEYPYAFGSKQIYAYGLLAVVPNLSHTGHVVILEGVTNSGLEAAASVLADETLMKAICEKLISADGTLKSGEFLIRTTGVGGNSAGVEIIGSRTHP
jgi:hypothetical protein